MSAQIRDVKFRVTLDVDDVKRGADALHNNLSPEVKALTEEFRKINDAATKANKEIQDGGTKSKGVFNAIGVEIKEFARNLNLFGVEAGAAFDKMNGGVGGAVKGLGLLKGAFAATGIGVFLIAIGSLISYFKNTEKGAESLERFMSALSAVFEVVAGRVARFGSGLVEIFKGNFKAGADQLSTAFTGIGQEIEKARTSAINFTSDLQDIEDAENNLALTVAKTRNQIELLIIKSKDRASTDKERIEALKQADQLETGILKQQIDLQQRKVNALQKENDLKVKSGQIDQGNKTDSLREAELELEQLIGNSIELRAKLQNRADALELAGAKKKTKDKKDLEGSIMEDVIRNSLLEEDRNQQKNDNILISDKDFAELKLNNYKQLNDDLTEDQRQSLNAQLQDYERFTQKQIEADEEAAKKRKKVQQSLKDAVTQISAEAVNALFDQASSIRDQDLEEIKHKQETELKLAGDNKQQQAIINNKYALQERELRRKQAQADKEQAVFNILLNTAVGVTKAIAVGPPAGFILAATVAALGAIQLAAAVSKPLPKFNKGTKSVPGQYKGYDEVHAMLAPEEMVVPTPTKRKYQPALDAIFDHKVPAELINSFVLDQKKFDKVMIVNQSSYDPELKREIKGLRSDIKNKRETHINIDKNGIETLVVSSNNRSKILNNYFSA